MNARWEAIDWRGELARLQNELHQALGRAGAAWQVEPGPFATGQTAANTAANTTVNAAASPAASASTAAGSPAATSTRAGYAAAGPRPAANSTAATTPPAINVWADEENIYVESELPGLDASDVEVLVTGRQLMVRGERKPPVVEKGVWHRQERAHGKFQRTLELPLEIETASVQAQFQNGVLLVKLPKHAEIRPRRVEVQVG